MMQNLGNRAAVGVTILSLLEGCKKSEDGVSKIEGSSITETKRSESFRKIDENTFLIPSRTDSQNAAEVAFVDSLADICRQNPEIKSITISPVDVKYSNGYTDGPFILDGAVVTTLANGASPTGNSTPKSVNGTRGYYSAGEGIFLIPGRKNIELKDQIDFAQSLANLHKDFPATANVLPYSLGGEYSNGYSDGNPLINGLVVIERNNK